MAFIVKRDAVVIPVASTASVTVAGFTGFNYIANGTYIKQSTGYSFSSDYADVITITGISYIFVYNSAQKYILLPPESSIEIEKDGYPNSISASGTWRIGNVYTSNEGENASFGMSYDTNDPATNSSANNDYIPTAGWSPAITITAA
jgi:hypothetical protein